MKQTLFRLTGILFIVFIALNGCKKDTTTTPAAAVVSPGKQIIYFKIVTPAATGVIDTIAKTIVISVPTGTVLTSLSTDVSLATEYTISPASGVAQNFTNPVVYTVSRTGKASTSWTVSVVIPDVTIDQDITASTTWTSDKTYIITGDRYVDNNSVLTIQPGTVIKFATGASLTIGYTNNATLIALGTSAKPIIFTSSALAPAAGAWKGLILYPNTLNNTSLAYCNIQYAGSNSDVAALNLIGCDISVNNCTISNSGSFGILAYYQNSHGGFVTFTNNAITNTVKYGLEIDAEELGSIGTGNTFTSTKGVHLSGNYTNTTAHTWKNLGVPYIISNELDIDGNLTIEAGTTFKFDANGSISVGYYGSTTFIADGTSASPITFTSSAATPTAGAWSSITFYENTQTNSKMNFCIVDYAGATATWGAVNLTGSTSITFTNNIVRNSGGLGVIADGDAGFQAFANNTINTCANHVIEISTKHLPDLGTPNTLSPATGKGILISGNIAYANPVTWKKQNADFYVATTCDIDGDLTIEAGSTFRFINDSYFDFGYYSNTKVTAIGTSISPIIFTSAASSPVAGAWRGLIFESNTQSNSALTYCTIQYGGKYADTPPIHLYSSFPVNNTTILNYGSTNAAEYATGLTLPAGTGNNFTWVAN